MTNSIGAELTDLESRLHLVEQNGLVANTPSVSVTPNPTTGAPVVKDSLTWDADWETHTKLVAAQPNPALPNYPSLSWVHYSGGATEYGPAQAIRIGNMGFLTGLAVRKGVIIGAGGYPGFLMFRLPTGWRPSFRVKLPCIMSGGAPGLADIEVRPDVGQPAGGVYYTQGTNVLTQGNGWIALQGAFPCLDQPAI